MDAQRELLRGSTPTLILAVLRDGSLHGYGIAREIEARSGHSLQCREGTLYPVLRALEDEGLLAAEWQLAGERPRKVYTLTPAGRAALEQRARTWGEFVEAVQGVLDGSKEGGHDGGKPESGRGRGVGRPGFPLRPEPTG
jgi:PadR family transcriptional regulator PadR